MSRIGNQPIELKDDVEFSIDADNVVTIKGDKVAIHFRFMKASLLKKKTVSW